MLSDLGTWVCELEILPGCTWTVAPTRCHLSTSCMHACHCIVHASLSFLPGGSSPSDFRPARATRRLLAPVPVRV